VPSTHGYSSSEYDLHTVSDGDCGAAVAKVHIEGGLFIVVCAAIEVVERGGQHDRLGVDAHDVQFQCMQHLDMLHHEISGYRKTYDFGLWFAVSMYVGDIDPSSHLLTFTGMELCLDGQVWIADFRRIKLHVLKGCGARRHREHHAFASKGAFLQYTRQLIRQMSQPSDLILTIFVRNGDLVGRNDVLVLGATALEKPRGGETQINGYWSSCRATQLQTHDGSSPLDKGAIGGDEDLDGVGDDNPRLKRALSED